MEKLCLRLKLMAFLVRVKSMKLYLLVQPFSELCLAQGKFYHGVLTNSRKFVGTKVVAG